MKALISAVAIALLAIGPARISADDAPDEATYRKATSLLKDARDWTDQSKQLIANAAKAKSAEEAAQLKDRAQVLLDRAKPAFEEARKLMKSIAPPDGSGFGPAQVWVFEDIYRMQSDRDGKPTPPSPTILPECERRLLKAAEWPDPSVQIRARFGLARLYRDTNRIEEAKKNFAIVAEKHPEYRMILAQWAKAQNEKDDVITDHAKAALAAFTRRLKQNADDHEARFGCVTCLMLLARFGEAEGMVNKGAALAATPELIRAYARKLVEVLMASFDAKENDPEEQFEILERAVKLDPDNPEIYNRILRLTKDKSIPGKVREFLKKQSENGRTAWLGNLYLGIDAFQDSKPDVAREYWEKAMTQYDGAPLVANNLAYLLAFHEPFDLPRALELASVAVKKVPTENRYRSTYGLILAKLGRYNEARPELEKGIAAYPTNANLFRALSETCGKLGDSKKAEAYKRRADALEMKPEAGGP